MNDTDLMDDLTDEEIAAIALMEQACPPVPMDGKATVVQVPTKQQLEAVTVED
jgi:hypothetical protein